MKAACFFLAAALLAVGLVHGNDTCDIADTTDVALPGGYVAATNVQAHSRVALDLKDIWGAVNPSTGERDFATGYDIYTTGKNSVKGDAFRNVQSFATADLSGEPLGAMVAKFESHPNVLDNDELVTHCAQKTGFCADAYDDTRAQMIMKITSYAIQAEYVGHELRGAISKFAVQTDGAAHAWDEGYAFYTGCDPAYTLWGLSDKRAKDFGTMDGDITKQNKAILEAFNAGLAALVEGSNMTSLSGRQVLEDQVTVHADNIEKWMAIAAFQASLKYAMITDYSAKVGSDNIYKDQAEGWAFYRTAGPYVAHYLSADRAAEVDQAFSFANGYVQGDFADGFCKVHCAITQTAAAMGIQGEIGSYTYVKGDHSENTATKGASCSCPSSGSETTSGAAAVAAGWAAAAAGAAAAVLL